MIASLERFVKSDFITFYFFYGDNMKIVSWNCAGKFREDYKAIFEEDTDIYVIQECENPKKEGKEYEEYRKFAGEEGKDYFWVGNKRGDKGLGIFKKGDIELKRIPTKGDYKYFIYVNVDDSFNLLAVWAMDKDKELGLPPYVEMIHDFLDENNGEKLFDETPIIMCGDFNSSAVFNSKHTYKYTHRDINGNPKNHTYLNCKLNDMGLYSVYHECAKEESGEEKQATFFEARHLNDSFHLDYVYTNMEIIEKTTLTKNGKKINEDLPNEFEILDKYDWINLSDHLPLVFKFDDLFYERE